MSEFDRIQGDIDTNHGNAKLSPSYDERAWFNYTSSLIMVKSLMVDRYRELEPYHPKPLAENPKIEESKDE